MRKEIFVGLVLSALLLVGCGGGGNGGGSGDDAAGGDFDSMDGMSSQEESTTLEMRPLEPPPCVPQCEGRQCGSDGCGAICGHCFTLEGALDDSLCGEDGTCKPSGCVPDCGGKECGDDGCSGSCGNCAAGEECQGGTCKPAGCVPDCDGKECGYDGCTGSCGNCSPGESCKSGKCVPCQPACQGKECGGDGCGGICGTCGGGEECQAGTCKPAGCVPDCTDKECGDDGCGDPCGECTGQDVCQEGQCVACQPACEGKECGDDGCSGSCGACPDSSVCAAGQCTCGEGLEWNPDGTACWPVCQDNASYVPEAGECLCDPGAVLGLDGSTCLLECPPWSHPEGGLCTCDPDSILSDDGLSCEPPTKICGLHSAAYPVPGDFAGNRFGRTVNTENKYPLILDKATGLTWQGCDAGTEGYTCTEGVFSLKKPASAATYCEGSTWAGYDDWHLPSMVDWLVVVDQGLSYPYGAAEFFWYYDKIDSTTIWWSSTKPLFSNLPGDIQLALMKDDPAKYGFEFYIMYAIATFGRRVRCVRDPAPPPSHCAWVIGTPASERVVYLEAPNLFWQGCPAGLSGKECQTGKATTMSWDEAVSYCENLVWGGFDDWSLPHLNLFATITDYDVSQEPLVDPAVLPGTPSSSFWTSKAAQEGQSWTFDHSVGQPVAMVASAGQRVRCVRFCPEGFYGPDCKSSGQ